MKFNKPKFWKDINMISLSLLPFSFFTLFFNFLKSVLIKKNKFKIPIICVGNIFIGGTGKTPLSIFIYNLLKKKKFKPAIIRKYYSEHLDEINFTRSKVKQFFSDKKRRLSILKAEQKNNDIIIMDDGFQDLSVHKNLSIICFNSVDLVGNGLLLPAGPLRDNIEKVKYCKIAVINGKRRIFFEKKLKSVNNKIKIYQSKYEIQNWKKFKGKKLLAFAGIGNPNNFFNLLKNNGFKVKEEISFPDHYNYKENDMKNLILKAREKNLKLITTEKDFFRIKHLGLKKIDYLSVNLKIINLKSFEKNLLKDI